MLRICRIFDILLIIELQIYVQENHNLKVSLDNQNDQIIVVVRAVKEIALKVGWTAAILSWGACWRRIKSYILFFEDLLNVCL